MAELAIAHVVDPVTTAVVPKIPGRRGCEPLVRLGLTSAAVAGRPSLFGKVGCISTVRPLVAVFGNFPVDVKVIENHRLVRKLMRVWSDVIAEQHQVGIAVAAAQATKHLIVGAVFANDVQNVLDVAECVASLRLLLRRNPLLRHRDISEHLLCISFELSRSRHRDNLQMPREDVAHVVVRCFGIGRLIGELAQRGYRCARTHALSRRHQQLFAVTSDANGAGIPAGGNESQHA